MSRIALSVTMKNLDVATSSDWRSWLKKNHLKERGIWLVFHRNGTAEASLKYDEALDEALAYGWIDSVIKRIDDQRYVRRFSPRRPWSIWSTRNITRVKKLREDGRMTRWGLAAFDKRTDEISMLERINKAGVTIPRDLEDALKGNQVAWKRFQGFSPSHRKRYLIWISGAKRPETRKKRIAEAVSLISRNVKNLLK